MKIKILGIDDNEDMVTVLGILLGMHKEDVEDFELFTDPEKLLKALTPEVQICIIDYYLPGTTGLELIKKIIRKNPYCSFIMISGQDNLDVIIEFMNNAYGSRYIRKGHSDLKDDLIFFIKDLSNRINTLKDFYSSAAAVKNSVIHLKESVTDLKKRL